MLNRIVLMLALMGAIALAQVPVTQAPPLHYQFFDVNGVPLAGGKIYTYAAGTTTLQNTYIDASGTTQNQDPILLDSTGSPAVGTSETSIFLANLSYKFVAFNASNVAGLERRQYLDLLWAAQSGEPVDCHTKLFATDLLACDR